VADSAHIVIRQIELRYVAEYLCVEVDETHAVRISEKCGPSVPW